MESEREADGFFRGWRRPGPLPPGGLAPGEGETLDYLCGSFRIFQAARGHRYSTDDLLVAWWGVQCAARVERLLDLGSGIGSVAMAAAWKLPGSRVVTIEAQPFSMALARRSVLYNGLQERFRILEGDLREPATLAGEAPFDLVLGAPPYFEPGTATQARHPQAVPARITLRGTVDAYAAAARRNLAPGGLFAFVWPVAREVEADETLLRERLVLLRRRDVVFREGDRPLVALFAASRAEDLPKDLPRGRGGFPAAEPPLVVRRRDGRHTTEYAAVRLSMGFPPGELSSRGMP
ncbi:MAG: methyltransferase [Holophagales bacterium]|nr:methyltransferase [Holophagales bacterium]